MEVATQITGLEQSLAALMPGSDRPAIERLVAPEFRLVGIRSTGFTDMSLADWLAAAREAVIHEFRVIEVRGVEAFGDAAVATVDAYWRADWKGQKIDERSLFTDVWIRRDGAWRLVRRHSSPYQPDALRMLAS